ncbi:TBC1 domain family member 2A isoform X2 [Hippoglossus hippoglossus]|uniref:TBC1 domain family member 2A isoform X2 n=1 Tax=Hippoglossus hippoglossus TaxID=8267 RepID=UPI00148B449B|nr:TBC1 domain family member 2A isoform X2 [Hippoglossus hippoglossus]
MDGIQENRSTASSHSLSGHVEDETKDGDQQSTKSQKHQRPAETPRTEEEPDHQEARTRAQKPESPSGNLTPGRSARTKPDQPKPDPCSTEQKNPGDSPVTDEPKPDPLKLHLKHSRTETQEPEDSPHEPNPQILPPTTPDQQKQDPHPKEKHNLGESSATDEPKPDQPKTIPSNPDPLWQEQPKSDHSQDQTQVPPEPTKDLTVFSISFEKQNQKEHKSRDQQDPHDSPPPPVNDQTHPTKAPTLAPQDSSSGEPKLCSFLQKQGGPLRAWKDRWFTYEDKKNQLFYYRTPQDVMPLGRVELSDATFTYPLKAETGTFHIKTHERTFTLKAQTQELMLYWLQQLQVKRWQHRQTSSCPDSTNNNNNTDDFLPVRKSPLGLVGKDAANASSQRTQLTNVSIKHPLIELQNSVHSLRKRSSQEWSQSVFHVEAPPSTPNPAHINTTGPVFPSESRESSSLPDSRSRETNNLSLSTMPVLRRDTPSSSSDRTSHQKQNKQMLIEEVKAQKELVWILHKALEASQLEKRTCAEFLAAEGEQKRLELLRHRERQVADLQGRLEESKTEAEVTRRSLAQRDVQLAELQDDVRILMDKNNAKQEVIIKLSDQVTVCMSNPPCSASSSGGGLDSQAFKQLQQENENLKDDIEAYKTQNTFLNSEIYQLTKLWRKSSEQEKSLMVKCAYLEASNCQLESRYLGVLQKLQETKSLDPVQRGAVQKMIEDALKVELKSDTKINTNREQDEYGFKIIPDYELDDMKLLAKIQALEIRSHNLLHQEGVERPLLSRWAQYLAGRSHDDLCPSPELKGLLRGGVPYEYRQRLWHWMVRARTRTIRDCQPRHYQQLCEKSHTSSHPASRQIQLDLHRTLTSNQHFSSPSSPAFQQLRRILLAFSWQNPAIGYCQGLNRLAAIALLVLQSEEDAFWCLVSVVETIMPQDYYTKNLVSSQADQRVFKDFLAEKLPRLASHFDDHSVDVSLITFNWFLVVFVESLPSDILLPLWDAFLYEGTKVIFRYALALFKYKEDDILRIHDSVEIYQYLRFFTKTISDSRRLTSIAFSDMNPFPGRLLRNRRALHLERLQGELRELEKQQREFVTEIIEHKDKELDTMVSEEDDEL